MIILRTEIIFYLTEWRKIMHANVRTIHKRITIYIINYNLSQYKKKISKICFFIHIIFTYTYGERKKSQRQSFSKLSTLRIYTQKHYFKLL